MNAKVNGKFRRSCSEMDKLFSVKGTSFSAVMSPSGLSADTLVLLKLQIGRSMTNLVFPLLAIEQIYQ